MKKLLTIIKREYLTRIKTKGFIFGTIAMPIFVLAVTVGPMALAMMRSEEPEKIAVIDLHGDLFAKVQENLDQKNKEGERLYNLEALDVSSVNLNSELERLKIDVNEGLLDGVIVLPADIAEVDTAVFHSSNITNFRRNREIERAVSAAVQALKIKQHNLDPELVESLTRDVDVTTLSTQGCSILN